MTHQLNIKGEDAYRLASQLAELTGESLTTAVITALRERLEREQALRDREARIARIRALTAEIRRNLRQPLPSSDHSWLYDENGLPK
jgi:antitoxin VapB